MTSRVLSISLAAILAASISSVASAKSIDSQSSAYTACKAHLTNEADHSKVRLRQVRSSQGTYLVKVSSKVDGKKASGVCTVSRADGSVSYSAS